MIASPERITQARELAGLSKSDLAELLGVSPAAVAQWESGIKHPTADNSAALARNLRVPMTMLLKERPAELLRKGPLTFRAWSSAKTRKANRKAQRFAELVAEVYLWLEEKISFPKPELPAFDHKELTNDQIFKIATLCRREWGLGDLAILKLGELLESKGIVLSTATFGDDRFDAFSCIVNGRPFVLLGDEKQDRARSRFDTAHELGHLVLHQHWTETDFAKPEVHKRIEREANLFAAAFLMPSEVFRVDVLNPSLDGFLKLKPKWGVSVQAMVFWSFELGVISESQYQELFRQMSAKGWRKARREPLDDMVPAVKGTLGRRSLEMLKREGIIQPWEIPSAIPLPMTILTSTLQTSPDEFDPTPDLHKIIQISDFKEQPASDSGSQNN